MTGITIFLIIASLILTGDALFFKGTLYVQLPDYLPSLLALLALAISGGYYLSLQKKKRDKDRLAIWLLCVSLIASLVSVSFWLYTLIIIRI